MFLNNLTCIDHAYIDNAGRVIGGSYHPNFYVSGSVDESEQVVIDFSKVKKQIKECIDSKEDGFDHKLWIIPGYSLCEIDVLGDTTRVSTPACVLEMPSDALKTFKNNYVGTFQETVQRSIQTHVWSHLNKLYPDIEVSVECQLTTNAFMKDPGKSFTFRYVHGLKNSSSWGCQNHSHGHLSWIEVEHDMFYDPMCSDCRRAMQAVYDISRELDGAILIFEENIFEQTNDYIAIQYTTERGMWRAKYYKSRNKIIVMDQETTIENIVDWAVNKNFGALAMGHIKRLYISEGLSKGAVKEFSI